MSSITDVAARAGVSVATVSRALRGLPGVAPATREVVRGAAAELGYVPSPSAAGLPTGRSRTIGVVVPWLGRWFFTAVVEGVRIDDVGVGYAATKHLLDLGHRRIGVVGGEPEDHLGFPVAPNRQLGYERALFDAGVMVDPNRAGSPPAYW